MSLFFLFQRQYRTFVRSPRHSSISSRSSNSSSNGGSNATLHKQSLLSEVRGMTMQPPSVTSKFLPSPLVIGPLCRKVDINRARAAHRSRGFHYVCAIEIASLRSWICIPPLLKYSPRSARATALRTFFCERMHFRAAISRFSSLGTGSLTFQSRGSDLSDIVKIPATRSKYGLVKRDIVSQLGALAKIAKAMISTMTYDGNITRNFFQILFPDRFANHIKRNIKGVYFVVVNLVNLIGTHSI